MLYKRVVARLSVLAAALAAVLALAYAAPAGAIINGAFDSDRHPNAGAIDVPLPDGGGFLCSGVLISPTYFATAAHCVKFPLDAGAKPTDFLVTLDNDFVPTTVRIYHVLDVHYDPAFTGAEATSSVVPNGHDYGVLHLAEPVQGVTPANLPALGSLDSMLTHNGAHPTLQSVGYGVDAFKGNQFSLTGLRNYADTFVSPGQPKLNINYLKVGAKNAGLCFGDSGGPTFIGHDTSTPIGLLSGLKSARCAAWAYVSRLDTKAAHDFFDPYD